MHFDEEPLKHALAVRATALLWCTLFSHESCWVFLNHLTNTVKHGNPI